MPFTNFARKPIDAAPGKSSVSIERAGLGHASLRGGNEGSGMSAHH
jgi:hypothetical protein